MTYVLIKRENLDIETHTGRSIRVTGVEGQGLPSNNKLEEARKDCALDPSKGA